MKKKKEKKEFPHNFECILLKQIYVNNQIKNK